MVPDASLHDDEPDIVFAAEFDKLTKTGAQLVFPIGESCQLFGGGFDESEGFIVELGNIDFAFLILFVENVPVPDGIFFQHKKADVFFDDRAVKITLNKVFVRHFHYLLKSTVTISPSWTT